MKEVNNELIRKEIMNLADEKYKKFHSSLCPNIDNIIGVRVPILREFAKKISREINLEEYLNNAWNDYYEEIMLQGMLIGILSKNKNIEEVIKYINDFVPKIDNWAICDTFCARIKNNRKKFRIYVEIYTKIH